MGLLDRFKKDKNREQTNMKVPVNQPPYDITFRSTTDGGLQVDFYDRNADFKQFYDTTRLVVSGKMVSLGNQLVNNCWVSHYGQDDVSLFDPTTGKPFSVRANEYTQVLANIDIQLLQTDPAYCETVMKGLLNEKRVEKYTSMGLQENPERPCGIYVGGVRRTERGYGKFFDLAIGRECHNSPYMQKARREYREKEAAKKQRMIQERQDKIAKLQSEIDEINL